MKRDDPPIPLGPSDEEIRAGLEGQRIRAQLRARLFGASDTRPKIGPYMVRRKLGEGGMGTVYDAELADGGRCAVKVLRDDAANAEARLKREGKALQAVEHPHLVKIREIGRCSEGLYIAMDYVEGSNLRAWARAGQSLETIVRVLGEAAAGLACAHGRGVVHRDVKPDNILVDEAGRARVCDFGLAAAVPGSDAEELSAFMDRLTASGVAVGTIGYMAPEQLLGRPVSPATDQFALAVTAFEVLYGEPPFRGATMDAVAIAILGENRIEPETVANPRLHEVLVRALAREPAQRHRDIDAFAAAMVTALEPDARGWWASLFSR